MILQPLRAMEHFMSSLWLAFSANFGGKPATPPKRDDWINRVWVFTCLLVGSIIFMSYRASLSAALAVQNVKMPFNSPTTFLLTDMEYVQLELDQG